MLDVLFNRLDVVCFTTWVNRLNGPLVDRYIHPENRENGFIHNPARLGFRLTPASLQHTLSDRFHNSVSFMRWLQRLSRAYKLCLVDGRIDWNDRSIGLLRLLVPNSDTANPSPDPEILRDTCVTSFGTCFNASEPLLTDSIHLNSLWFALADG